MHKYWQVVLTFLLISPLYADEMRSSPNGGCTQLIVEKIDGAQDHIQYQMYVMTSKPIAEALVRAHNRGVDVKVLLDKRETKGKYSLARYLKASGIKVMADGKHAIAHQKIRIIDGIMVLEGSFNDTLSAETRNSEHVLLLEDPKIVNLFVDNFNHHYTHSVPYVEEPAVIAPKAMRWRRGK